MKPHIDVSAPRRHKSKPAAPSAGPPQAKTAVHGWTKEEKDLELALAQDKFGEDDNEILGDEEGAGDEAGLFRPSRPEQGLGARMLFRVLFLLMVLCPVVTLAVAVRAIFGSASEDTGAPRWSPPSSPMVPVIASLVALPLLAVLIYGSTMARRRCCKHLEGGQDFWGHNAREVAAERAAREEQCMGHGK